MPESAPRIYRNLDLLRAIAVLLVFFTHSLPVILFRSRAWPEPRIDQIGRFAVLIFFVHTALVLMMSMERNEARRGLAARFYIDRLFRIYPLAIACVLCATFLRIDPEFGIPYVAPHALALASNLTLTQNLFPRIHSLSGSMWSLPYEVQMYVVLPASFLFVQRWRETGAWLLVGLSLLLTFAEGAFTKSPWITEFAPCFMGGILAFALLRTRIPRLPASGLLPAIAACLLLYGALGLGRFASWAVCISLGALLPLLRDMQPSITTRNAHLVARYSYGIYLCHMPLLTVCFARIRAPLPVQIALYVAATTACSIAAYHLIERPMIQLGHRLRSRSA